MSGPMLVLTALLGVLGVLHLYAFDDLSPVDELAHFDNLVRSSEPDIVPDPREQLSPDTLREVRCRSGHEDPWNVAPAGDPCLRASVDAAAYSWRGLNPSIGHVPVYYLLTGVVARTLRFVVPGPGILVWARLAGLLWTLVGCLFVLLSSRLISLSPWRAVPAIAIVLAVPAQLAAETMVNPDASLFFVGALLLYVVLAADSDRLPAWLLLPASAFAALLDPSAFVGVLFAAGFLGLRGLVRGARGQGRWFVAAAVLAPVTAVLTTVAWNHIFRAFSTAADLSGSPQAALHHADALPLARVLGRSALLALMPPVHQPFAPEPLRNEPVLTIVALVVLLLVGALVGQVLTGPATDRMSSLAVAVGIALVVAAPLMIVRNYLTSRWYFEIPNRYGLSGLPALSLIVAHVTRSGAGLATMVLLAGGLVLAVVEAMT